jgi:hypothetical protein
VSFAKVKIGQDKFAFKLAKIEDSSIKGRYILYVMPELSNGEFAELINPGLGMYIGMVQNSGPKSFTLFGIRQ